MKHSSCSYFRTARHLATATSFAALLLSTPSNGKAATKTYIGPDNGNWNTAANWNPNSVPTVDDAVVLGSHSAGTANLRVTYDGTGNYFPDTVTLDSTALSGSMIVNQTSDSSYLRTQTLTIGRTVPGNVWNMSAGRIFAYSMVIGNQFSAGSGNVFNLSGTGHILVGLLVGASGSGTFNQSGGTYDVGFGGGDIGFNYGSNGTYNLSGGVVDGDGVLRVALEGNGVVNQSGGTVTVGNVDVGGRATGTGTYNMTGGALTANFSGINVGGLGTGNLLSGVGVFNLSGGTATGFVVVGDKGTFNLQSSGTLNLTSGNNGQNLTIENGGLFVMKGGVLNSSTARLNMSGGEFRLNTYGANFIGLNGTGGSILSNSANALDFGSVATLTLNVSQSNFDFGGNIGNSTGGYGLVGITKNGSFQQTFSGSNTYGGPTALNAGTLKAGSNGGFSTNSAYTLSSGALLDANGFMVFTGSLAGAGGVVNVGSGSLGTGGNNQSTTFSGTFNGSGMLAKVGAGELTLSNSNSPFNGTIDVQGGSLRVGSVNGVPTGASVDLSGSGVSFNVSNNQSILGFSGGSGTTTNFLNNSRLTVGTGVSTAYLGSFTGSGEFRKLGTGTLTLGSGANDTVASMTTGSAVVVNVTQGTVALNKADGTVAIGGPLMLNGGNVTFNRSNQIADNSPVTVNSGMLSLNGFSETIGNLDGTAGTLNNGGTLTVTQSVSKTFSGALEGGGSFVKNGSAPLTLTGVGSYGGTFTSNTDHLYLQGSVSATGGTANNGGILDFVNGTAELNGGALVSKTGGYVQYFGATINNASLQGPGPHIVVGGMYPASTLNNVTATSGTTLFQNGPATLHNFTNGGTIQNNAALTYNGGLNLAAGTINVNSTVTTSSFGSNGVLNVPKNGFLSNTTGNLALGSGSRTNVGTSALPGGTLSTAPGTTIELSGGVLANYGAQNGVLNVNNGSTAKGSGSFGTVNVKSGGQFGVNAVSSGVPPNSLDVPSFQLIATGGSAVTALVGPQFASAPATANAVSLSLSSGSFFAFELQDAQGTAGNGYDLVHATGMLTLASGTTPGNQITISLASVGADGFSGSAVNFDPSHPYKFVLVQADGGVVGFNAGAFTVETAGFHNSFGSGKFSVEQNGNNLVLAYNVVPEPGVWAMLGFGGVTLILVSTRRRPYC